MTLNEFITHIRSQGSKALGFAESNLSDWWSVSYVNESGIVFHASNTDGVIDIKTDLKDFDGYVEEMKQSLGMKK